MLLEPHVPRLVDIGRLRVDFDIDIIEIYKRKVAA